MGKGWRLVALNWRNRDQVVKTDFYEMDFAEIQDAFLRYGFRRNP